MASTAILLATPFTVILIAICWALYRALANDDREQSRRSGEAALTSGASGTAGVPG